MSGFCRSASARRRAFAREAEEGEPSTAKWRQCTTPSHAPRSHAPRPVLAVVPKASPVCLQNDCTPATHVDTRPAAQEGMVQYVQFVPLAASMISHMYDADSMKLRLQVINHWPCAQR